MKARSAVKPLITALQNDSEDRVREAAATALGKIGDPSALNALISALGYRRSKEVRAAAAEAIGLFGNLGPAQKTLKFPSAYYRKSSEALKSVLRNDSCWEVQKNTAQALGRLRDSSAHQLLIDTLVKNDSRYVRAAAAEAIGDLGSECSEEENNFSAENLKMALHAPLWEVRVGAAKGIAKLIQGNPNLTSLPYETPLRKELEHSLKEDGSLIVRAAAAEALGAIRNELSIDPLISALEAPCSYTSKEDDLSIVHAAAAEALGDLGEHLGGGFEEAVQKITPALEKALHGNLRSEVRSSVALALSKLGQSPVANKEKIISILVDGLLDDSDISVQESIIKALKNLSIKHRALVVSELLKRLGNLSNDPLSRDAALRKKLNRAKQAITIQK